MSFRTLLLVCCSAALFAAVSGDRYTPAERRHWSFQKRAEPAIPAFTAPADTAWTRNPVDAFVLARLQKDGLRPAPPADRPTLIRRVYFDLLGVPPSPAEVEAFTHDKSPDAYARLVDRLLASPQYGERWGRHWLDVVRFSETDGFEYDTQRSDAWRYRDYVIRAFNEDRPYDQFVREQIAGDEIDPGNRNYQIASGFHRLGPLRKNAGNQEVASSRNEVLTEMTNAVGSALLGVTLGCARCHDHKFDPIRQKDYYRIQAYFSETHENDIPLSTPEEQTAWKKKTEELKSEMKQLRSQMKRMKGADLAVMEKKLKEVEDAMPDPLPSLFTVSDNPAKATPIHVLARGDYQNKGEPVGMRPLGVLLPDGAPEVQHLDKPRVELANFILAPDNPLTARVLVNRLWQYHFGRGIVATPNDFGRMGARPTHPELLDYLANRFVQGEWRMKPVHKLILLSNTYQQASASPSASLAKEKDPENKLFWKFSRRRLEAEEIRDAMLSVAGVLNGMAGGQSVIVPVEKELVSQLYKPSQWTVTPDAAEHNRRSVYLLAKRNLRLPFMEVFDSPDMQLSCPRREASTHPPQALELMNGDLSNRLAEQLARRLRQEAGPEPARQVDLAYRLTVGRAPTPQEKDLALSFLDKEPAREFALAMLNLNRFLYVD